MGQYADDEIARQQEEMFGFSVRDELAGPKQRKIGDAITLLMNMPHIKATTNNKGIHIMIQGPQPHQRVDFWPTTGLWRVPGNPQRMFGLEHLVVHLNQWKEV